MFRHRTRTKMLLIIYNNQSRLERFLAVPTVAETPSSRSRILPVCLCSLERLDDEEEVEDPLDDEEEVEDPLDDEEEYPLGKSDN